MAEDGFSEVNPEFTLSFVGVKMAGGVRYNHVIHCTSAKTVRYLKKAILKAGGKIMAIVQTDRRKRETFWKIAKRDRG